MAGEQQGGGSRSITPEQRVAEREVYAGAQDAGVKIAGLAEVTVYEDSFAGSKAEPVLIGQKISMTVRVGADGSLLPRRENSDSSTPPATSILTIDVIPSVEFDSSGDPHVIWNGHASQVDVGNARVIASSLSGPSRERADALEGNRAALDYGNDPEYIDGILGLHAKTPAEAVAQALGPLASSGRMNVGEAERPPSRNRRTKRIAAVVVPVVIAAGTIAVVSLTGDSTPPDAANESVIESPLDESETDAAEDDPPEVETDGSEVEPVDDAPVDPPPATETEPDDTSPAPGTYDVTARIDGPCGSYDVFLRMILFLNGQLTIDQLLTAGGNAFQSASGRWGPGIAVGQSFQPDLFEVWMVLMVSDALTIYNVYGPAAGALSADGEVDPSRFSDIGDAEALAIAVDAAAGYCASQLLDVVMLYTAFPG